MKKYLLLITLVLVVAPLVAAGCVSPTSPSPSPSPAASTATSAAKTATSTSEAREYETTRPATATSTASATATASQQTFAVTIPSTGPPYSFQPSTMTVPRGASVLWRNDATVPHQIVSNTGAFSGPIISPGQTYTHQFTQAGTYPYHCAIHPYMTGTITVQ